MIKRTDYYTPESQWPLSVTRELNRKRAEWENFKPGTTELTGGDRLGVRELVTRAVDTSWAWVNDNPLYEDGLFLHLFGMREEKFPMGVNVFAIRKEDGVEQLPCSLRFCLSSPSYWMNGKHSNDRELFTVWEDDIKCASHKVIRSWANKILKILEHETEMVGRWEQMMLKHGFYVLPTGFESVLPVGEEACLLCTRHVACVDTGSSITRYFRLKMQSAREDWVSRVYYGVFQDVPGLVRQVMNKEGDLELMLNLTPQLKQAMI